LSAPGVASDIDADYTLTGLGGEFSGSVGFHASTLAGASIAPGTTARFSVGAGAPRYAAAGEVSNLDLQQIGVGVEIAALAADRFRSRVNASFDVEGSGGGRYPLAVDATGTIVDSELFGASFPRLAFSTALANGDARVEAAGQFAGLDPAVVSGNEQAAGSVPGTPDVDATLEDYDGGGTLESVHANG